MKIKSPFRDYYDGVQGFGFDDDLLYVRTTKNLEKIPKKLDDFIKKINIPNLLRTLYVIREALPSDIYNQILGFNKTLQSYEGYTYIYLDPLFLMFCGKAYLGVGRRGLGYDYYEDSCFNTERLANLVRSYEETRPSRKYSLARAKFELFLRNERMSVPDEIFQESEGPSLLIRPSFKDIEVILNPNLGKLRFGKEISPADCYQEIRMFLGRVLVNPEPVMVKLSDKEELEKKGFDAKISFRKEKGEGKRKRSKENKKGERIKS